MRKKSEEPRGWRTARTVYLRRYFRGIQRAQPARWQFGRSVVLVARWADVNANTNAFKLAVPSLSLSLSLSFFLFLFFSLFLSPRPSVSLRLPVYLCWLQSTRDRNR